MVKNTNGRENGIQQHIRATLGTPGRHKLSYIRLVLTKHRSLLQQTKHFEKIHWIYQKFLNVLYL